ncbi:hypothetical protein NHX12_024027 [Muraenolepis orangiensis]|uniref:Reverse transcriptase domain-containing protein n=1 Tax=Muraenolepis orangiensis TaxID=630683 RepID=A0A9Q0IUG0_9TELE|nr:hypothetical protein NHX12_024027 [Muraenolepis orangiensis]
MLHILRNYSVPDEIVKAIAIMYDNPSCFVQSTDGLTKEFFTTAGILQEDTLASFLFVILVDYILRQSLDIDHTNLDYVDDIALTADQLCDAQDLLTSLENATAKVGLFLNVKKTVYVYDHQRG